VVGRTPDVSAPAGAILANAAAALRAYSERYGAYPWRTYTVAVTADARGARGIEYPTLVLIIGRPANLVVAHETAHQWFYSLVGNDQARDPWLDEGLTTWAESRHDGTLRAIERIRLPRDVRGRLGQPTSLWDTLGYRKAFFGVYVQGVQALASLGDPERVDCALRSYVTANAYRTAAPRDLLTALRRFFPDARTKLVHYGARF
jgi:aminopeptidase N